MYKLIGNKSDHDVEDNLNR